VKRNIKKNCKVLDFGCGSGEVIQALRKFDIDAYGCDIFYAGGKAEEKVPRDFFKNEIIKNMESIYEIPFHKESFDIVISNMVLEHVEDLNSTLKEFKRVLVKDGIVISIFPDKGVWREGHCGVWFLHWFPPKTKFRRYYALLFRIFGLGYNKEGKGIWEWCVHKCNWLDKWTYYLTQKEIKRSFKKYFKYSKNYEDLYLKAKFPKLKSLIEKMPKSLIKFFINKLGTQVFVSSSNRTRIIKL
tara:strand:+ start:392 stop:1120 length:729 start_codon:yes stop_codon:yes gene_type:complete